MRNAQLFSLENFAFRIGSHKTTRPKQTKTKFLGGIMKISILKNLVRFSNCPPSSVPVTLVYCICFSLSNIHSLRDVLS